MPNIDQVQLPDGSQYNLKDDTSGYVTAQYVDDAIGGLTKANVGLGNVDNTSDLNKPVSTAQQTALNGKTDTTVIAPTEATTTASRRYEIGEQFSLSGVLYTATAVIASGDSIIVDTNCELSESITEQIKEVDAKTQHGIVELWKNSNIGESFAGQSIQVQNVDSSIIDGIEVVLEKAINETRGAEIRYFDKEVLSISGWRGSVQVMNLYPTVSKVDIMERSIAFSLSGTTLTITFGNCVQSLQSAIGSASTTATVNNACIPVRILGLIHND